MKECFHFTKNKYLRTILEQGLQPTFGTNCSIIGDQVGAKVSYSVGSQGATKMFVGVHGIYSRMAEGRVNEEGFDEHSLKAIHELQQAKDFEDWEGQGVYLVFDGECIDEEHRVETKPYDAYTDMPISPEQLRVCVIRNKETGEMISSKYDIVNFWLAREQEKTGAFYRMDYSERIEEPKSDNYEMEYVELARFCELHPELLGEEKDIQTTLPQVIDESKSKFGFKKIVEMFGKIKNKIKSVFTKGETSEQGNSEVDSVEVEHDAGDAFMDKLRDESKTIEESATEIIESEEEVKNNPIEPQTPEEI